MNKQVMMKMAKVSKVVSPLILLMSFASTIYSQQLAFPTAEACAKGGSGHRFGGIGGNQYATYHHNLIAHNDSRNPRWASGCGFNDYRDNVLYNWGYQSSYGAEAHQRGDRRNPPIELAAINVVAKYYKAGPATVSGVRDRIAEPSSRSSDDEGGWYIADNYVDGFPDVTANNWLGIDGSSYNRMSAPWDAMPINQAPPQDAHNAVLAHAGCSKPNRDNIDRRIIQEVRNGTATYGDNGIITTPSDVGGWPQLQGEPAPCGLRPRRHSGCLGNGAWP